MFFIMKLQWGVETCGATAKWGEAAGPIMRCFLPAVKATSKATGAVPGRTGSVDGMGGG